MMSCAASRRFFVFCLFALLATHTGLCQNTRVYGFRISSAVLGAGAAGGLGAGTWLEHRLKPLSEAEILALNPRHINALDRIAARQWHRGVAKVSDVYAVGLLCSPLVLYALPNVRAQGLDPALLMFQTYALNYGLNSLVKPLVHRTRPFVYNPDVPMSYKTQRDARLSFFSAHTSGSASACFLMAKIYHDTHPESSTRPYVWAGAAILPAVTGLMRIKAGKHFPTDVFVGYLMGALVGIVVPEIHLKR
ncbi:MAG: phosphatase PAP2 family protein [Cytophagales bacterium]|nr:MAG: phosphatase PAP2 family protein [Cytophagales bacterium]TAF61454.1 MAG: phosphatase PAP2 family protein [Cytophagales bacterium]